MSRIYFHSQHGEAELYGAERAYLDSLSKKLGMTYFDLDSSFTNIDHLMEAVVDSSGYLTTYWREAQVEEAHNNLVAKGGRGGYQFEKKRRFIDTFKTSLNVGMSGLEFQIGDKTIDCGSILLNTALLAGSDEIALAAKIHGYCEIHAFVEGPHRQWLSDLMQSGLDKGIYRGTLQGHSMGWEKVIELLRSRGDEPVVMSYSVCDSFPNSYIAGCENDGQDGDSFYDLSSEEQWQRSLSSLKENTPWLELNPDSLRTVSFSYNVTAFDIMASDRVERLARILETSEHND